MEPSLTSTPTCLACGSTHRRTKEGTDAKQQQRCPCQSCRRFYIRSPQTHGYDATLRHDAVRLYMQGLWFRKIGRLLGVPHQSVINGVRHEEATRPAAALPASVNGIERDELYTFVEEKTRPSMLPHA